MVHHRNVILAGDVYIENFFTAADGDGYGLAGRPKDALEHQVAWDAGHVFAINSDDDILARSGFGGEPRIGETI